MGLDSNNENQKTNSQRQTEI